MRFGILAAAAALAMSAPANSATFVTITADAVGTRTTNCLQAIPECMQAVITPISMTFVYSFDVDSVADGASFGFDTSGPFDPRPAQISGTFTAAPGGGIYGTNFSFYQDQLPVGSGTVSRWELAARTFSVDFAGNVPEPSTWALMIGGFGLVGGSMRHRRRKAQLEHSPATAAVS